MNDQKSNRSQRIWLFQLLRTKRVIFVVILLLLSVFTFISVEAESPLVIVQIADLHSGGYLGSEGFELWVDENNQNITARNMVLKKTLSMKKKDFSFVVATGDLVHIASESCWNKYARIWNKSELDFSFYTVQGNHETLGEASQDVAEMRYVNNTGFQRDYFFEKNGFQFFSFGWYQNGTYVNEAKATDAQIEWFNNNCNPKKRAIAFLHYPLDYQQQNNTFTQLAEILKEKTVLSLSGHIHRFTSKQYNTGHVSITAESVMMYSRPNNENSSRILSNWIQVHTNKVVIRQLDAYINEWVGAEETYYFTSSSASSQLDVESKFLDLALPQIAAFLAISVVTPVVLFYSTKYLKSR